MDKVYIVTSGAYSDYHIDAVFINEEKAKAYCECHTDRQIEEYELSDSDTYTPFNIVEIIYHLNPIYVADLEPKFEFEKLTLEEYGNYDKNSDEVQLTGGDDRIILQRRLPDIYDEEEIRRKYTKAFYDLKAEIKYMLSQQDTSTYEKRKEAENNILEAIKDKFGIEKE